MRVIAGSLRGRSLYRVPSSKTRPTSDKVKEAVFHKLGPYFDGGEGLDLFAGSGALGIEALSRGMEHVTFIERHPEAIATIRKNIKHLQLENRASIYRNDASRALDILHKRKKKFHLILLDPPYNSKVYASFVARIRSLNLLHPGGYLYLEHAPKEKIAYDTEYYTEMFRRDYSKEIAVTILQVHEDEIGEE